MQQIAWPYFGRGITGQLGQLRFPRQGKKESTDEYRIPKVIGKGYNRPKSVDSVSRFLQQPMSSLSISANAYKISKRPVSSTPTLSSAPSRCRSCCSKSSTSFNTIDDGSSVASSDPNDLGSSDANCCALSVSNESSIEGSTESDDSRGIGTRAIGESYPKFNINTRNATRAHKKENPNAPKEACGFLRNVITELDEKERAEELAKKKAKKNASFNKEQLRQIDRENQILLQKLIRVEKKGSRPTPAVTSPSVSSNRKREMDKEAKRIKRENQRLYMKIKFARPSDDLVRATELG